MSKVLLVVAGIANFLFFLFHIFLGYQLHRMPGVSDLMRGFLQTFNAGGMLVMAMLAYVFLARGREVMSTGLGAAVLAYGAVLYLARAAEEFIWMRGNVTIAAICVAVGLLHALVLVQVRVVKQGT